MNDENKSPEDLDRFEADAVCEQCETVNPPGSLFCRTCGENLRDQRMQRLSRQEPLDLGERQGRPRRVLAGLLTVFGMLLILWTAIKVWDGSVERWLTERLTETSMATSSPADPSEFWTGASASFYDRMARFLQENPVSLDEIRAGGVGTADGFEGRYFITSAPQGFGFSRNSPPVIGYAYVRKFGDAWRVVAQFSNNVSIRAELDVREGTAVTTNGAVRSGTSYVAAFGYAKVQEDGSLDCQGQTAIDNTIYRAIAYRVP